MPGEEYVFDIQAISNDLESDITVLRTRTSKKSFSDNLFLYLIFPKIFSAIDTIRSGGGQQSSVY